MPVDSIVKLLEEAQRDAHTAGTSLRLANADATAVPSIVLVRLIEDARALEDSILRLKSAIRDDAEREIRR